MNQVALALPPLFLAVGLAWLGLCRTAESAPTPARARTARVLAGVLLAVAALDAATFHTRVNLTRSANDIRWDAAQPAPALPDGLAFMAWQTPPTVPYTASDLSELVGFLRSRDDPFLLVGDASILYGLTDRESVAPALWLHAGLTMPRPDDPAFAAYEDWLLARMETLGVRYVVLEGRHTWNHTTLADFPRLARRVVSKKTPRLHFGGFRVVDLGAG